jgi:GT2 family glycosyltransferase/LmbE family N-acetylglucosaminyl deacetylase
MQKTPKLVVIIPVYGQLPALESCLNSLLSTKTKYEFDIVLVDDGTPGGLGDIAKRFEIEKALKNKENMGFTAAVNKGLHHCAEKYDAFILINSDMEVLDGCIDALVGRLAMRKSTGLVGGMELSGADPDEIVCGGTRPIVGNGRLRDMRELDRHGRLSANELQKAERLEWAGFGIVLISKHCYDAIGPLDPRFRNYFSDADYGLRANMAGFEVWYEPKARVLHKMHLSTRLYRTLGIMLLQADRESYCKKWLPNNVLALHAHQKWALRFNNHQLQWRPRLLPHLTQKEVPSGVPDILIDDESTRRDVETLRELGSDGSFDESLIPAIRRLYLKGLVFMDISDPGSMSSERSGFLKGSNLEILAPHADDAALSLGGSLLSRKYGMDQTRVHVLFGKSNHAVGRLRQLDVETISRLRSFEEATFCSYVTAGCKIYHMPDRLLRNPRDPIFLDSVKDVEFDLVGSVIENLAGIIADPDPPVLMAPLGAGLMADHAIVAVAAASMFKNGLLPGGLLVYDDLPYVTMPGAVQAGLDLYRQMGLELTPLCINVSHWFEQKCELLSLYASQMEKGYLESVEQYGHALTIGRDEPGGSRNRAERVWKVERAK